MDLVPHPRRLTVRHRRSQRELDVCGEPGLNGRALHDPRGEVIGGSSAIDGMIAMRGQAADRDGWHAQGLEGWGWSDMVGCLLGDGEHHGAGGGWRVEEVRVSWPFLAAVRDAPSEIGVPPVADFNTGANEGSGYLHPS